jgi:hypothetical protein
MSRNRLRLYDLNRPTSVRDRGAPTYRMVVLKRAEEGDAKTASF